MDTSDIDHIISKEEFISFKDHFILLKCLYSSFYNTYKNILFDFNIINNKYLSLITDYYQKQFTDININIYLFKTFFNDIKNNLKNYPGYSYSIKDLDNMNILLLLCIDNISKSLDNISKYSKTLLFDDTICKPLKRIISTITTYNTNFFDLKLLLYFPYEDIEYYRQIYQNNFDMYC